MGGSRRVWVAVRASVCGDDVGVCDLEKVRMHIWRRRFEIEDGGCGSLSEYTQCTPQTDGGSNKQQATAQTFPHPSTLTACSREHLPFADYALAYRASYAEHHWSSGCVHLGVDVGCWVRFVCALELLLFYMFAICAQRWTLWERSMAAMAAGAINARAPNFIPPSSTRGLDCTLKIPLAINVLGLDNHQTVQLIIIGPIMG